MICQKHEQGIIDYNNSWTLDDLNLLDILTIGNLQIPAHTRILLGIVLFNKMW